MMLPIIEAGPTFERGQDFGTVLRRRRVGALLVSESAYHQEVTMPRHAHSAAMLCVVLDGLYVDIVDGRARLCEPATSLFLAAGEAHSNVLLSATARDLTIEIEECWLESLGVAPEALQPSAENTAPRAASIVPRLVQEFEQDDDLSGLALQGLVLELLVGIARSHRRSPGVPTWLERARIEMSDDLSGTARIDDLAARLGIHPVHLAAEFSRHFGCTIGTYLRRLRVMVACRQLSQTALPLKEVSAEAGFFDQSHFTRTFKSMLGMTPGEFRRRARPSSL